MGVQVYFWNASHQCFRLKISRKWLLLICVCFLLGWFGFFEMKLEVPVLKLKISSAGQHEGFLFNTSKEQCFAGNKWWATSYNTRDTLPMGHFFQFSRRDVHWWTRALLPGNTLYCGCAKGRRWWDGTLRVNPKLNEDTGTTSLTWYPKHFGVSVLE